MSHWCYWAAKMKLFVLLSAILALNISTSQSLAAPGLRSWWAYGWRAPSRENVYRLGSQQWYAESIELNLEIIEATRNRIYDITKAYIFHYKAPHSAADYAHLRFRFFEDVRVAMGEMAQSHLQVAEYTEAILKRWGFRDEAENSRNSKIAIQFRMLSEVLNDRANKFFIERQRWNNRVKIAIDGVGFKDLGTDLKGQPIRDLKLRYPDGFLNPLAEFDILTSYCTRLLTR